MNSWFEAIRLPLPLRDVRPAGLLTPAAIAAAGAKAASDELLRASYERGRIDGEKALSEQLIKQRNETHAIVNGVVAALREAVPKVIEDSEHMLVALALEVAQKLVADMPISAPMVEAAVRDALTQVEGTAQLTVRLHPADLELLQKVNSPVLGASDETNECRFLGSPEVTRGGCLVQTRFGTVDARRETKFDLLKRSLLAP
jgi:flagellar assembly protein FliH